MDELTEKNWFIYITDHHEGPFPFEEIRRRMDHGTISFETYLWCEGMPDWKTIQDLPELLPYLTSNFTSKLTSNPEKTTESSKTASEPSKSTELSPSVPVPDSDPIQPSRSAPDLASLQPAAHLVDEKTLPTPAKRKFRWRWVWAGATLVSLGSAWAFLPEFLPELQQQGEEWFELCRPTLLSISESFPSLQNLISPLPPLKEISEQEYSELQEAARPRVEEKGGRFALALSQSDPLLPSVFVASNLPDGAQFHLYLIAVPDTLIDRTTQVNKYDLVLTDRLGKTDLKQADGTSLPAAEYQMVLTDSETEFPEIKKIMDSANAFEMQTPDELPKNLKILTSKTYFLGGTRDEVYLAHLKNYHDKLRMKATDELAEVRQFTSTLENQLTSTLSQFSLLKKGKIHPKQKVVWNSFRGEWLKLEKQLDDIFLKWTPDNLHRSYFNAGLYRLVLQVGQSVSQVHKIQNSYFTGVTDSRTFEIQFGEASSSAQTAISLLRSKIEQTEKLTPTPNGMPRRLSF